MMSGCVAVLSDCAGNIDILEHGKTGIIFSSVDDAVEKIISLVGDNKLGAELSVLGREYCKQSFSIGRYVREFIFLIQG